MKTCTTCGQAKPLEDFPRSGKRKDGSVRRNSRCKACGAAWAKSYRKRHPERWAATRRRWETKPEVRERRNAWRRDWSRAHRHVTNENDRKRRARKRAARVEPFTTAELYAAWEDAGMYACVACGAPWEHVDHIVPLSKGGPHSIENLQPLCAACNLSKSDRDPWEWAHDLMRGASA